MSVNVFISYTVETESHNKRVIDFSNKLKLAGLDVYIFNDMKLGERFQFFMEKIQSCDFTLFICTPEYKKKADNRQGGVGYEWNIITANFGPVLDERRFIPVLFSGSWETSLPIGASGKNGVDYRKSSKIEFNKLIQAFSEYEADQHADILDVDTFDREAPIEAEPENSYKPFRDKQMLSIVTEDGTEEIVEVLLSFELDNDPNREYMVYTKNEQDTDGNVDIYVARVIRRKDGEPILSSVPDRDWPRIKHVLTYLSEEED